MSDDFKRPLGEITNIEPMIETPNLQTEQPKAVMPEKKKPSRAFSFVSVLLLLAILGAGVMTYLWYDTSSKLADVRKDNATLSTDNAALVSENSNIVDQGNTSEPTEASTDDKTLITQVVTAKANAPVGAKDSKITVNIMKQGAEFAYVSIGYAEGGGVANILKKVNGIWVVIFSGQEAVSQEVIDNFGIPKDYQSGE